MQDAPQNKSSPDAIDDNAFHKWKTFRFTLSIDRLSNIAADQNPFYIGAYFKYTFLFIAFIAVVFSLKYVIHTHINVLGSAVQQYNSLIILCMSLGLLYLTIFKNKASGIPLLFCITAFTLIWGREIFCGYLYFDELMRWVTPVEKLLSVPINDHFTPLMLLIWNGMYGHQIHGSYWMIALVHYIFGVLAVVGTVQLIKVVFTENILAQCIAGLLASVSTLSPRIWIWKGCGDSPLIAWALFIWLLYICIYKFRYPGTWQAMMAVLLYISIIGSSSLITIGFIYLLPLFCLRSYRERRFIILFLIFCTLSGLYWIFRSHIIHTEIRPHKLSDLPGALAIVAYTYSRMNWLVFALLSATASAGFIYAMLKREHKALTIWLIALAIFVIGTGQIWGARQLKWDNYSYLLGYHLFLPYMGISILIAVSLTILLRKNLLMYLAIGVLIPFYACYSIPLANKTIQHNQLVMNMRQAFTSDLCRLIDADYQIPNYSAAEMRNLSDYDWCPIDYLTDPDKVKRFNWPGWIPLSRIAFLQGKSLKTLPTDTPLEQLHPDVQAFINKYFIHKS